MKRAIIFSPAVGRHFILRKIIGLSNLEHPLTYLCNIKFALKCFKTLHLAEVTITGIGVAGRQPDFLVSPLPIAN